MLSLSSSPSACIPPVPCCTRSDPPSASSAIEVSAESSPTSIVARQAVTWISRLCPALAAAPETLEWRNGAWAGDDPSRAKTIEDVALYAHGTGALPPGVEGGLDAQTVYRG